MKKTIFMLVALSVLSVACTKEPMLSPEQQTLQNKLVGSTHGECEAGTILIQVTKTAQKSITEGTLATEALIAELSDATIEPVFPISTRDDRTAVKHNLDRWYSIKFDSSLSLESVAKILAVNEMIYSIEYNSLVKKVDTGISIENTVGLMTKAAGSPAMPFNDPELGVQWNLINTGDPSISETAVEGADVGVKDAWRLTAGDPRIIVAVFDQGVKYDHEDLAANMWTNPMENNGSRGKDDDNNEYVDDIHGYNFIENTGELSYSTSNKGGDHGTHVAGTIAATNNNGKGISSIAGGSGIGDGVRIMSCQIFDAGGQKAGRSTVAKAFHYAAKHGACIAQCSYGEDGEEKMNGMTIKDKYQSDEDYRTRNSIEHEALMFFLDPKNSNCDALESNIAVFSAGNFNKAASLYPGALKGCISVTAICPDFLPGGYSNYGAGCDIAAPGGDIVQGDNKAPCMILSTGCGGSDFVKEDTYAYKYGTSMACPHISGVLALGMSYALKIGKHFSRQDFISRLLTSSVNIDQYMLPGLTKLYYNTSTKSYNPIDVTKKKGKMGTGTVNAWNFLMALEGTPTIMTRTGEKLTINLSEYLGGDYVNVGYSLSIDEATMEALGIETIPATNNGTIEITCTKSGAGKIRFNSSVGAEGQISGLDFFKEISIVSRKSLASNGGWL